MCTLLTGAEVLEPVLGNGRKVSLAPHILLVRTRWFNSPVQHLLMIHNIDLICEMRLLSQRKNIKPLAGVTCQCRGVPMSHHIHSVDGTSHTTQVHVSLVQVQTSSSPISPSSAGSPSARASWLQRPWRTAPMAPRSRGDRAPIAGGSRGAGRSARGARGAREAQAQRWSNPWRKSQRLQKFSICFATFDLSFVGKRT